MPVPWWEGQVAEKPEHIRVRLPGGFNLPPFGIHQFLALTIVCVAIWSLGVLWLGMQAAGQWVGGWQGDIRVHVYLDAGHADQAAGLKDELSRIKGVAGVQEIKPAEAARWMQTWLGDVQLDSRELERRLPLTFELSLASEVPEFLFADIRDAAERHLAHVNEDEVSLAQAHRWLGQIRFLVGFASLILALAMALIISNTLRMILIARADEIELMRLLGAKEWFVRLPFILEGMVLGAGAGLCAWLLLWPLVLAASDWLERLTIDPHVGVLLLPLLLGGTLIGCLGALLATTRVVSEVTTETATA